MKTLFFLSLMALNSTVGLAQNSAVINQQGTSQEVSIIQQGTSNRAVINQSTSRSENRASVVQVGSGNVTTINQGNEKDSSTEAQNSVTVTQSGKDESIINQTTGENSIRVYQSDNRPTDRKKKPNRKKAKK